MDFIAHATHTYEQASGKSETRKFLRENPNTYCWQPLKCRFEDCQACRLAELAIFCWRSSWRGSLALFVATFVGGLPGDLHLWRRVCSRWTAMLQSRRWGRQHGSWPMKDFVTDGHAEGEAP
jgi:hypothetical protein